jgi:hypothetical protein
VLDVRKIINKDAPHTDWKPALKFHRRNRMSRNPTPIQTAIQTEIPIETETTKIVHDLINNGLPTIIFHRAHERAVDACQTRWLAIWTCRAMGQVHRHHNSYNQQFRRSLTPEFEAAVVRF